MTTDETLRARFWELMAQKEAIEAEAKPLRDEYEQKSQRASALLAEAKLIADQFKVIEAPAFDIAQELATIARALKGKTGERPG
jgi:hypothetical protein